MLSVSLPFRELTAEKDLGSDEFLECLAEAGVQSVELRAVLGWEKPETVLAAAERVWRHNMRVSVHTAPMSEESAVQDIFTPLKGILQAGKQENTILVLHPVKGEELLETNRRMMHTLTDYLRVNSVSAKLALENNRKMPDRSEGDSAGLVMQVIREIDPAYAGLCFDFGHFAWATRVWEQERPVLPPEQFRERVIHTHIHALAGQERKFATHYPLRHGTLPLREYIDSFRASYTGAYNVELEQERFADLLSGREGILESVSELKRYI